MALLTACGPGNSDRKLAADGSLIALDDLKVGESARVAVDDTKVIVTRTGEATAVAFDATCTHLSCTVKRQGDDLACPCHGSAFDPRTGAVTNGPASSPLRSVAVKVEGGKVLRA
jgi:nitrite reductase/ring-hydroxylating ferredoxin subunit